MMLDRKDTTDSKQWRSDTQPILSHTLAGPVVEGKAPAHVSTTVETPESAPGTFQEIRGRSKPSHPGSGEAERPILPTPPLAQVELRIDGVESKSLAQNQGCSSGTVGRMKGVAEKIDGDLDGHATLFPK